MVPLFIRSGPEVALLQWVTVGEAPAFACILPYFFKEPVAAAPVAILFVMDKVLPAAILVALLRGIELRSGYDLRRYRSIGVS